MIVEEIDTIELERKEKEELKSQLSRLIFPKGYYLNNPEDTQFFPTVTLFRNWLLMFEVCHFYTFGEEIMICVKNNKYFKEVRDVFEKSDLRFRVKY